jgi:cell wall-associated NlpC family hydrolase
MWAWSKGGKSLPHSSRMQYSMTQRISMSDIQPGDLIFYGKPQIHHVALYIGNGQIIHAPNSRSVVRIDSVYYWNELVGAGRIR